MDQVDCAINPLRSSLRIAIKPPFAFDSLIEIGKKNQSLLHNIKLKLYMKDRKQTHTFINRCQIYPLSYINVDW